MLSKVKSCGLLGINGYVVEVETDISNGIPAFEIVGLGDAAVKESKERVRAAIRNSGLDFPTKRITINLAPANLRKEGSSFDLAIAVGIMAATNQIYNTMLDRYMFIGELSLDGEVKPVRGVLPMAMCALENGIEYLIISHENADEAAIVKGISVLPAKNLQEVVQHLNGEIELQARFTDISSIFSGNKAYNVDFADVKGQRNVKRALEIAASGSHNCILIGSPGSGKTMLARRLPTILPELSLEEALEVTKIHSIAGLLPPNTPLITCRPFRSPHHTISATSLVGGGRNPRPGEVSLAHYGVLFLDEIPEFGKEVLEVLRQPLEDGMVTISRLNASFTYPAQVMLVCAANPCKCGNLFDEGKVCTCTPKEIQQYLGKLSGPLLDRIDIHIEVASVKYEELSNVKDEEKSESIRERVNRARKIQLERYKGLNIYSNSQLQPAMIDRYCRIDDKGSALLKNAYEKMGLSARAHHRILKVARTIADMDESEDIKPIHLAEAIQYRSLDRRFASSWKRYW